MSSTGTPASGASAARLPDTLRLGPVELTVPSLDRSIAFYERSLGLRLHRRDGARAAIGAGGDDLVVLVEEPDARRPAERCAGLYHFALLLPTRAALAHAARRLASTMTRVEGASDHGVSEAIYLADPDGNGIELYADRPRDRWPAPSAPGDRLGMYTVALDLAGLLALAAGDDPPPHADPGLRMGHVHLHVGDVERAIGFYRDVLGFEPTLDIGSAAFVSAGGYHHHLAFNVWRGRGVPPAPIGAAGLRHWTIVLDRPEQVGAVRARVEAAGLEAADHDGGFIARDPWEIAVLVTAGVAAAARP